MQFVAVLLLCALGTWVFSGLDAAWRMLDLSSQTYFENQNVADLWVTVQDVDRSMLTSIDAIDGVEDLQARVSAEFKVDLPHEPSLQAEAYDGKIRINKPLIREGLDLDANDLRGCLLDELFAKENGLAVGDKIVLKVNGIHFDFVIRGTCLSPEFAQLSKSGVRDPLNYGFILLSSKAIDLVPLNHMVITLDDGADADDVRSHISALYPDALIVDSTTQSSVHGIQTDAQMYKSLSYVFPLLAFAVAAMIVLTTLSRMLENQRMQMGTLKALGYRDGQMQRHYLCYAFLPSLAGSLLGLFVGRITLPYVLWNMESARYVFPECLQAPISWEQWFVCGLGVLLSCFICLKTYKQSAREVTAALLRPKPPKAGEKLLLERFTGLWSSFGFNAKMIIRNLFRNKSRTAMSLVGVLCCTMLIITSLGLSDSVEYFVGKYYEGTLQYTVKAKLDGAAGTLEGYQKRTQADRVEGVMDMVISARSDGKARTTTLSVLQDDQELMLLGENETFVPMPLTGVMLSQKLAEVLRLNVGDEIQLWLPGDKEGITTTVSAIAYVTMGQTAMASETAWNGFKKGAFIPTSLNVLNPSDAAMQYLSSLDEFEEFEYPPEEKLNALGILQSLKSVFSLMSGAALGLAFVVLYNMGILNFSERYREYATLKVLGYHQKEICRLMINENNLLTLLGTLLGIYPGKWLTIVVLRSCESDGMVFASTVTWQSIVIACTVSFVFSYFITRLLTQKVKTIDMVEALKSVE